MIAGVSASSPGKSSVRPSARVKRELQKETLARLQRLRTVTKEINRAYLANLERRILDLSDQVSAGAVDGDRKLLKPQVLAQMIGILDDLSVKPEKGKRKGLRKIEEAIKLLSSILAGR